MIIRPSKQLLVAEEELNVLLHLDKLVSRHRRVRASRDDDDCAALVPATYESIVWFLKCARLIALGHSHNALTCFFFLAGREKESWYSTLRTIEVEFVLYMRPTTFGKKIESEIVSRRILNHLCISSQSAERTLLGIGRQSNLSLTLLIIIHNLMECVE